MTEGWIKLHRQIEEWEWYTDINTCHLFIHLLFRANHKPKKWRGMVVETGQCVSSYSHLAQQTGLSVRNVRTSLEHLKMTGEVTCRTTNRFTLVTVVNYPKYQLEDTHATSKMTSNRQATDKQPTTNKNEKNEKNEEKESVVPSAPPPSQEAKAFFDDEINRKELIETLVSRGLDLGLVNLEVKKFVAYWTEKNGSGKKQRWELEKTFELSRRLSRWFSNIKH